MPLFSSKYLLSNDIDFDVEIYILQIAALTFIFRTAIPSFKYPFLLLFTGYFIFSSIRYRKIFISKINETVLSFSFPLLLFVILGLSFIFSSKLYLDVFKILINTAVLVILFFFFNLVVTTKERLQVFMHHLSSVIVLFALIVSIKSIYVFFSLDFSNDQQDYDIDYNFAIIPIFFGFFYVLQKLYRQRGVLNFLSLNLILYLFSISICISGSRRGLFLFLLLYFLIGLAQVLSISMKHNFISLFSKISRFYFITSFLFCTLLSLSLFTTSDTFKNKTFALFGIEDTSKLKNKVAISIYKYAKSFDEELDYNEFYLKLWIPNHKPEDPGKIWINKDQKIIHPLIGRGVEIVPEGSIGIQFDSTCLSSTKYNNAYYIFNVFNQKLDSIYKYKSTVYCYMSPDFNGSWARIIAYNKEKKIHGNTISYYDNRKKGEWQKLEISFWGYESIASIYISIAKNNSNNFNGLKGYVIFSSPETQLLREQDSSSFINYLQNPIIPDIINSERQIGDNTEILFAINPKIEINYQMAGFLDYSFLARNVLFSNIQGDPIRTWLSSLFSEDTTYYEIYSDFLVNKVTKNFTSGRTSRWKLAIQIFTKEHNFVEKIIGGGFTHLNWFGYYFYNDKTKSDWPHNPFLSILLYSGVIGLILYIYVIYKAVAIYIKYFKEYYTMFIFFCVTFFFSFFSSGTPFDPPVMGFFVLLPFFIDFIHKKDRSN